MYTTYATEYKILFQSGLIDKDSYRFIPKSTRNEWKSKNFDNIYGVKEIEDLIFHYKMVKENRIARSTLYGLCKIIIIYKQMLNSVPNMKKLLFENKNELLRNIDLLANLYDLRLVLKLFGLSYNQVSYWKNHYSCKFSPVNLCRKIAVNQLAKFEISTIKQFVLADEWKHWSLRSLYYLMIRESSCHIHISTFYKYVALLGLKSNRMGKPNKNFIRIRASVPLQIVHMDITEYRLTDNLKVYVHIVADNFSRKPLGVIAGLNKAAILTCENLKNVYDNFLNNEKRVIIYTDGGSENRSVTEAFISGKNNMEHRICQKDGYGSNSMIEAIIKKIKQCFIYPNTYTDFDDFNSKLEKAITIYSEQMPLDALGGKTPNEAFYGIDPFPTDVTTLIKTAALKRKNINRYGDCL